MNVVDKVKFSYAWHKRNLKHSEVMLKTLEVQYDVFFQYIFIEHTNQLLDKLTRLGFTPLTTHQDDVVNKYAKAYYNDEYNIVFNLYQPEHKLSIHAAVEIASRSMVEKPINVLYAAFRVLLDESSDKKPQILLG